MKFKVGDRVRFIKKTSQMVNYGAIGEILSIDGSYRASINFYENSGNNHRGLDEIELVRIKNTKIARKLYPHYKEDGEWLIMTGEMNG